MSLALRRRAALMLLTVTGLAPAIVHAQGCLSGTLADEFTADRFGLVRDWVVQLPSMAPGCRLDSVSVGDGIVVAETSDGVVHAIQATPGQGVAPPPGTPYPGSLLWSKTMGRGGGNLEKAGIGADLVVISQGNDVSGLERSTGRSRWLQSDRNLADAGAAVVGDWVYSPNGGGMTRFATRPLRPTDSASQSPPADASRPPAASPEATKPTVKKAKGKKKKTESLLPSDIDTGGSVAYQPLPFHDGVLWCTTDGLLVTLQPTDSGWQRLEFSLDNPPAGPPAVRNRRIFAATTNGDLARIDLPAKLTKRSQLELVWHSVLDGPAESAVFVTGDTVVVSLGEFGIAAYSAQTGVRLWQTCFPGTILSAGGGRVWLIDRVGRLSSLDLADGMRRETLCLGPFSLPLVNLQDDRLLLASPSGMIVSLSPRTATPVKEPELPADRKAPPVPPADADADTEPMTDTEPMSDTEEPAAAMAEPDANQ